MVQHQTNPLCRNNLYKSDVVSLLPKLVKLDGTWTVNAFILFVCRCPS